MIVNCFNYQLWKIKCINVIMFVYYFCFELKGGAKRCTRNRLCSPCHGHRRRRRSGMERSSIFRAEKFQSPRGENPNGL